MGCDDHICCLAWSLLDTLSKALVSLPRSELRLSFSTFLPLQSLSSFRKPLIVKREKDSWEDKKNVEAKLKVNKPKRPYKSELQVFNGQISNKSFWKQVMKPLPLICFPGVVFSTFVYGSFMAWLIVFSVPSVNVFSSPPYNLNPAQVGLTHLLLLAVGLPRLQLPGL
ncbi:hypothetical protein VTN02DRAFT_2146 [Thermoascus thermophilus]